MSQLSKIILMAAIFVLVFSAGGAGQEAAAAPSAGLIGKTQITGPGEFSTGTMSDPVGLSPILFAPLHYLRDDGNAFAVSTAWVKFPKAKIGKWVKGWVVDNYVTKSICMTVYLANPKLKTVVSTLGSTDCTAAGSSVDVQMLKVTFNQKVPAGKHVIAQFTTWQAGHWLTGVQGGFLK